MKRYSVADMACQHCVGTITQAIEQADPNATVNIDLAKKTVAIESAVDDNHLQQAMRQAGYEAQPIT